MQFYSPEKFRTQHKSNRQASNDELINPCLNSSYLLGGYEAAAEAVRSHNSSSLSLYKSLIDAGVCREQARGVLPQNLYTQYYGTTNLNNLLKFIDLRTHDGAQWEIRKVANACLEIAQELFPVTVGTYSDIRQTKLA